MGPIRHGLMPMLEKHTARAQPTQNRGPPVPTDKTRGARRPQTESINNGAMRPAQVDTLPIITDNITPNHPNPALIPMPQTQMY